ncbi:type II secretion system protein [Rhodocyclus tenuis]|uniref:Type II secretion system protein n=1 Tax=Rhodocyclus gracilis TaxID=2929842 RepID=A0ABX0WJE8_9RHOO|nr:type II secretion system protein [Rhodocyclus gracilis]NJA88936.1 type II secretion system protein [Rhodocyclus gracilis]
MRSSPRPCTNHTLRSTRTTRTGKIARSRMAAHHAKSNARCAGFSLLEMAIVLVVIGLLCAGTLSALSTQRDGSQQRETAQRLADIHDALLGFAAANGRLPCPAAPPPAGGTEAASAPGVCSYPVSGYLPANTLGLAPGNAQGYAVDAWGNAIRYAVFNDGNNTLTTPNGIKNKGMPVIAAQTMLTICASASGITATSCGAAPAMTTRAAAVVYSTGKNGTDEARGGSDDAVFVAQMQQDADDPITWLSLNLLFNRMIAAGQLP